MKRFLKTILILFLIYTFLGWIIQMVDLPDPDYEYEELESEYCDEFTLADSLEVNDIQLTHSRSWYKYSADSVFCLLYKLSSRSTYGSKDFRNAYETRAPNYEDYWRNVYYELYEYDKERISFIQDSLQEIAFRNSLTRNAFANLLVSFVQDIPYNYVVPGECIDKDHPCTANEKFGILSPIEFLYSLSGDCDTRSVLLYALFKHFDYNPLIVISNEYRHAMIALDIPASGDYILHKGKKFYFWETTNVGWLPGMLPPDVNNKLYWKITLDHEYTPIASRHR